MDLITVAVSDYSDRKNLNWKHAIKAWCRYSQENCKTLYSLTKENDYAVQFVEECFESITTMDHNDFYVNFPIHSQRNERMRRLGVFSMTVSLLL
jgi:hypothetical protein